MRIERELVITSEETLKFQVFSEQLCIAEVFITSSDVKLKCS